MIKYEQYLKLADEFQCNMGVAEWESPFYPQYTNIRKMPDELKVIILTNHMISECIYQKGIREVIRLETKYKNKTIKRSTLYEKAIDKII